MSEFLPSGDEFMRLFMSEDWDDINLADRIVLDAIDKIKSLKSVLYGMIPMGKELATTKPYWLEEPDYVDELTGTLSTVSTPGDTFTVTGNLFGATPDREKMLKCVRLYGRLRYDDGVTTTIAKVTAVDATLPILTLEATSGTSMPSNSTGQVWTITNEPATDAEDAHTPRSLGRKFRYSTSELFTDLFTIEKTRANTAMVGVNDEPSHQLEMILNKMERLKAKAVLMGWPELTGGGDPKSTMEEERATLTGLDFYPEHLFGPGKEYENPEILLDVGNVYLDQSHIDRMVKAMEANGTNFNEGNWKFVARPEVIDRMQSWGLLYREMTQDSKEVGFNVERVRTERGVVVNVMREWFVPRAAAQFVDISALKLHPFKGMKFLRGELSRRNLTTREVALASRLVGLVMREAPQKCGKIKNIKMA